MVSSPRLKKLLLLLIIHWLICKESLIHGLLISFSSIERRLLMFWLLVLKDMLLFKEIDKMTWLCSRMIRLDLKISFLVLKIKNLSLKLPNQVFSMKKVILHVFLTTPLIYLKIVISTSLQNNSRLI